MYPAVKRLSLTAMDPVDLYHRNYILHMFFYNCYVSQEHFVLCNYLVVRPLLSETN